MTVGALVRGLPFTNGQYSGGETGWLTPFAVLCGIGLCLGYALLGAYWLAKKCDAEVRDVAHRQIPVLALGVLAFLVVVFAFALAEHLHPNEEVWLEPTCISKSAWFARGAAPYRLRSKHLAKCR